MTTIQTPTSPMAEHPPSSEQNRLPSLTTTVPEGHVPNGAHVDGEKDSSPAVASPAGATAPPDGSSKAFDDVLQSDIGVSTLLNRLKQSIASARDFTSFLKKRSSLEEENAQGLRKLCRSTHESVRRPENRQGSYAQQYDEITRIHERMAENGLQFSQSLHQMHEDLVEMTNNIERGRKQWKQSGLSAEKRVSDSELLMEKAKAKYDSLAEDYDRARTGDRQSGMKFGLKGPKSAAQHEEDLHRKVQAADTDYANKVQTARSQRRELLSTLRPQAVKALVDLIKECDSALTLQLQKFASFNEKLILSNGICVSPIKAQQPGSAQEPRSLREVIHSIDNERDLRSHIVGLSGKLPPKQSDIQYRQHPTLGGKQQTPPSANYPRQVSNPQSAPPPSFPSQLPQISQPTGMQHFSQPQDQRPGSGHRQGPEPDFAPQPQQPQQFSSIGSSGPPQLPPIQAAQIPRAQGTPPPTNGPPYPQDLPPLRPVFGVPLDTLFRRDASAVPMVVSQCLQAVDLYGLDVEGIYRLSGTGSHVNRIKAIFDNGSAPVDFRNPDDFMNDVNSVAGVLKQFFRDLPDPLLTSEHYAEFIEAAKLDDETIRRDSVHAIINSLPDPNYATLRALILHLHRVQEHSASNRMNAGNLAICFGPTLMGSNTGPNIADAGYQVTVVNSILHNTYQIFDDD
ncbi:MAG: SET domain-containing protein 4 [Chaenotheca gracillima]|nr:MAG: SET domain-containing protein 4 [Chaenotheca gracillima]